LSLRAVTKPGDVVVLESPTYFGLLQAVESLGLRALELPTHATTGMDLEHLQLAIRKNRIAAVLAVPSFNNPLGSCMPTENRQQLVDLLGKHNIPPIERASSCFAGQFLKLLPQGGVSDGLCQESAIVTKSSN
jgi:DNA-binding transcriptional MocR family regulator